MFQLRSALAGWSSRAISVLLAITAASASLSAQSGPTAITGLEITPDGGSIVIPPNTTGQSFVFDAKNNLITSGTWSFSCSATGNVSCVSVTPASATYPSGGGGTIRVGFNTLAAGSGRITLSASGGETGYIDVDIAAPGPPAVTLRNHNRDNLDRSLCLTAAAGESAAWSCGDLVLTHAMPGYTTMNRERNLTLIHNSATAWPRPAVAAIVNQSGRTRPNAVYAELKVAGTVQASSTYLAWSTGLGSARQVVLDFNAGPLPTGAYPIQLRVQNQYTSNTYDATVDDTLLIVNRFFGEFGAGFGLAGVEQLFFNQPVGTTLGHLLWVGGDGSAKLYRKLNATTWVAPKGAFQDTISLSGSIYTRSLRHGVKVQFDGNGRHKATINRTGQTTTFTWQSMTSGAVRLVGITVPPTGQATSYTLGWDGNDNLDFIRDPASRTLNVTIVDGRLTVLTDPDGYQTKLGWDADRRIVSRENRLAWVTRYEYSKGLLQGSRVTKVTFPTGLAVTASTVFEPWNDKGLATGTSGQVAIDTAQAYTRVLGPRANVADDASFWVDRWGAPTKIVTPAGATTTLVRGDPAFPALVTRITHPNDRITDQSYNTRGNLKKVRDDIAPVTGDPLTRVTEYEYLSPQTKDSPSAVWDSISGTARKTRYTYTTDGLTDTVYDPRGHRTSFTYKTSGALKGLLIRSTEHSVESWVESSGAADNSFQWLDIQRRFDYDAKGNLQADTSAVGAVTSYKRDLKGRITDVYDPLKTRIERVYDDMNRVTALKHYTVQVAHPLVSNPLAPCQGTQAICADNTKTWDPLPNPVVTTYKYDAMTLDTVLDPRGVRRAFTYWRPDLVTTETDDYDKGRNFFYNEAGQITSSTSRAFNKVRFYYDAAGRRTAMVYEQMASVVPGASYVIPGDSIQYEYDLMGNPVKVTNREGRITRLFARNGLVRRKTMEFFAPGTTNVSMTDVITYTYDATGALRTTSHGTDLVTYNYAASTGELNTMAVQLGAPANITRTFSFLWDSLGRRRRITYPTNANNPMAVEFRYDKAGVLRRLVSNHQGAPSPDILTLTYRNVAVDPIGRVIRDSLTCVSTAYGSPCQGAPTNVVSNDYNRLSALLRQAELRGSTRYADSMSYDASGNMMYRKQEDLGNVHTFALDPGPHNRLASFVRAELGNSTRIVQHNDDGARQYERRSPWDGNAPEERYYHYDGLGRMTGTAEWVMVGGDRQFLDRPDVCRYDGDGRMIGPCENGSRFLTLDGDNASGTIQTDGNGWHFFHGPELDDPLMGYFRGGGAGTRLYLWVTDGDGREFAVADTLAHRVPGDDGVDHMGLWRYAGGTKAANTFDADRLASSQAPKLSFFRNRAYDQESGRWTQEDPIGLAGGVNLYQFNGNNPVSNGDPFGLCPDGDADCELIVSSFQAAGEVAGFLFGGGTGLVETVGSGGVLTPVAVAQTFTAVAAGGAAGRALGEIVSAALHFGDKARPKDASEQRDEIQKAQETHRKRGQGDKINRIGKSKQRGKQSDMKKAQDALDGIDEE